MGAPSGASALSWPSTVAVVLPLPSMSSNLIVPFAFTSSSREVRTWNFLRISACCAASDSGGAGG